MKLGTCRGCGASVYWARTTQGKSIPLDVESEKRVVVTVRAAGPDMPDEEVAKVMDVYKSHFATCPKADEFRRARS